MNLRTTSLRLVRLPSEAGMVPKMALLVMSKLLSCWALPMELGMVPVSWLLYRVSTVSLEVGLMTLGMEPVRLLFPAKDTHALGHYPILLMNDSAHIIMNSRGNDNIRSFLRRCIYSIGATSPGLQVQIRKQCHTSQNTAEAR